MHHAWVFADQDFSASGRTWHGLNYHLNRSGSDNKKLLNLTITGAALSGNPVFILQIAGPWDVEGILCNILGVKGIEIILRASVETLVSGNRHNESKYL